MKLLHTSDWHLGKSLYDFSLLEDQSHFIRQLLDLLASRPVDAVLLSGDVYDRPIPGGGAIQLYDHFLSQVVGRMGIPVLAIAGNHDSGSRLEFGSSLYRNSGYYVVGAPQAHPNPVILKDAFGPVQFVLMPYLHPADVRGLLGLDGVRTFDEAHRLLMEEYRSHLDLDVRTVALAHGFFGRLGSDEAATDLLTSDSEVNVGGADIVNASLFEGFSYAALGHLHAPQQVGERVRYSGSPLKYSLSEERQNKSLTIVELDGAGNLAVEPVVLPPLRDLRQISGTMEALLEPSSHQNQSFGDYVFARIEGPECLYPMQKLRALFPRLLGLQFAANQQLATPRSTLEGGAVSQLSQEELFRRFYLQATGNELTGEHLAVVRGCLEESREEVAAL